MALQFNPLTEPLFHYLIDHSLREPDVLRRLRDATAALPECDWQVAPEQAQFMALLARISGVGRFLELGTFTGYGTLAMALALPEDGRIVTCDIEASFPDIGKPFWEEAGVAGKIEQRLQPALDLLDDLVRDGHRGTFDMAFIDADKPDYPQYYERCLPLIREGGLVLIDNVLWGGAVIDAADTRSSTRAIRETNRLLLADKRVEISMIPIGDGLTIARKVG